MFFSNKEETKILKEEENILAIFSFNSYIKEEKIITIILITKTKKEIKRKIIVQMQQEKIIEERTINKSEKSFIIKQTIRLGESLMRTANETGLKIKENEPVFILINKLGYKNEKIKKELIKNIKNQQEKEMTEEIINILQLKEEIIIKEETNNLFKEIENKIKETNKEKTKKEKEEEEKNLIKKFGEKRIKKLAKEINYKGEILNK